MDAMRFMRNMSVCVTRFNSLSGRYNHLAFLLLQITICNKYERRAAELVFRLGSTLIVLEKIVLAGLQARFGATGAIWLGT